MTIFQFKRPMLALSETYPFERYLEHIRKAGYLLGSYKLDGIRTLQKQGQMVSRTLTRFRSNYIHSLALREFEHFDGEGIIKPREIPAGETVYHLTYSAMMTIGDNTPLDWWVFDYAHMDSLADVYQKRYEKTKRIIEQVGHPDVKFLEQRPLYKPEDIEAMEKEALDLGFEGLIVRRPDSPYHCNRSSFNQGYLMKIVRADPFEAEVEDIEEMMYNANEAKIDARGFTKRSSHIANKTGKGMMGALWVRDLKTGVRFKVGIGEGWDHTWRKHVWEHFGEYKGKILTGTYKSYGTKDAPRQPKGKGWRDPIDIGTPENPGVPT